MKYFAYCRKSTEGEDRQALSIPAQIDEVKRAFADQPDIEILEWLEEKKSAKAPGRSVYSAMIQRIEAGEADGIVAWHPDRLARNSVDGGWIIHLLDRNVIKDLKFVSYTFEKSPQGMFMLQIMFGQSKYYVDALSVNVKRGMRKKIAMGWWANKAPLGYKNDKESGTIVADPERYALIRRLWDMLLTGAYSVAQIRAIANDEWGFRTPACKNSGGRPLSRSALYQIFSNPFYAGILRWEGEWHPGNHQAMISTEEFNRARTILYRDFYTKPVVHDFAYTGLIRCPCGLAVTAEEKRKPSGRRYVYYHCTRRGEPRCNQPAVRVEVLEDAIRAWLTEVTLPEEEAQVLETWSERGEENPWSLRQQERKSLTTAREKTCKDLRALTELKLRDLLDDGEYLERKRELQASLRDLETKIALAGDDASLMLELGEAVILFRKYAAKWFSSGSSQEKRLILQSLGSNPMLADGKLSISAAIPFWPMRDIQGCPQRLAVEDAIGTPHSLSRARELIRCVAELKDRAAIPPASGPLHVPVVRRRTAPRGRASWRGQRALPSGPVLRLSAPDRS